MWYSVIPHLTWSAVMPPKIQYVIEMLYSVRRTIPKTPARIMGLPSDSRARAKPWHVQGRPPYLRINVLNGLLWVNVYLMKAPKGRILQ